MVLPILWIPYCLDGKLCPEQKLTPIKSLINEKIKKKKKDGKQFSQSVLNKKCYAFPTPGCCANVADLNWDVPIRRKWQPTPVFLPGESQGRGSLVGCRLWGRTESDTTEATWQLQQLLV